MEKQPHILIIGAGLIGLSTADSLLARGARVTIVEKRSGPAKGASFCNSGMIHPSQARPWQEGSDPRAAEKVAALAARSRDLLKARMIELGLSCAARPPGTVQIFDSIATGLAAEDSYQALGAACENITGAPFTFARFALRFPGDASGNAYEYCAALARSIEKRGAAPLYNVQPDSIVDLAGSADHVVIAAGAQSAGLARFFGIDLPIFPVTGHALNFTRPDLALPDVPLMHHATHSALTVFDDHVRLSGTVDEGRPEALLEVWKDIAPKLIAALGAPLSSWSGERPMCSYGRPIIARSGKENIWINAGHAHMGWTLSAGSGALMAELILSGQSASEFCLLGEA